MFDTLFSPLVINRLEVPNRLVVPAMVSSYCNEDGTATEQFIAYHEEKAKGGWGMIIVEDYAVDPAGRAFRQLAGMWRDSQMDSHRELTHRVRRHSAKIIAQLYHCGRQTRSELIGTTPVAPSPIPDSRSREVPRALTLEEIGQLVERFGDTALRLKEVGFDGVEIHGGHGYLIAQFLSLYANKRIDRYGGNLTNRMRFALEIIANIRGKVGPDFVVGFRISMDELVPGGRTIADTLAMAPLLEAAGIDYIHASAGVGGNHGIIPPAYVEHAWTADFAGRVRQAVGIPVIAVGRINDPYVAEQVLRSGRADLIAMGRASLCDPHLPRKARDGRPEDIRTCIGCNEGCQGQLSKNLPIRCVLNPALGEEDRPPKPTASPKRVAVVGAGPGGLEAARTAAEIGHAVTLFEQSGEPGGQFRLAAVPPCKGEIAAFIQWQMRQLAALGVDIRFHQTADPAQLESFEEIILATGAIPALPPIPGIDGAQVVTAAELLAGRCFAGERVVVIGGGQVGAETANYLALQKRKVTLVELLSEIAPDQEANNRTFLLDSLKRGGVELLVDTRVEEILPHGVRVQRGATVRDLDADTVVVAVGAVPDRRLSEELEILGMRHRAVGDAAGVRQVMDAVREGYRAALEL